MMLENMNWNEKDGVVYLTFPALEKAGFVNHAFSTRRGGVSTGEFAEMNLNFGRGDSDEAVRENFRRICAAAGISPESLVFSAQDHHTRVLRVTKEDCGAGFLRPRPWQSVDGLITNAPGVTLVTAYADCTPLFFVDPVRRAVGLAHAGWRGTAAGMGRVMVEHMKEEFGTSPRDLLAAVGPAIGPCCYEVDEPCAREFLKLEALEPRRFVRELGGGKYKIDLWEANRRTLLSAGVREENISAAGICTKCHSDLLWSHRVCGTARGGLSALLQIRPNA